MKTFWLVAKTLGAYGLAQLCSGILTGVLLAIMIVAGVPTATAALVSWIAGFVLVLLFFLLFRKIFFTKKPFSDSEKLE